MEPVDDEVEAMDESGDEGSFLSEDEEGAEEEWYASTPFPVRALGLLWRRVVLCDVPFGPGRRGLSCHSRHSVWFTAMLGCAFAPALTLCLPPLLQGSVFLRAGVFPDPQRMVPLVMTPSGARL
jgi:hypothetical protein